MADYNKPSITSTKSNFVAEINALMATLAKMHEGTSDSNIPTNAKRLDLATSKFYYWDAAMWVELGELQTAAAFAAKADKSGDLSQFSGGTNLTQIATRNFSDLQSKPTTLSGYGITDAAVGNNTNNISQFTNDSGFFSSFSTNVGQTDTGEVSAEAGPTNDTQALAVTGIGDTSYAAMIFATVRRATNTGAMSVVFLRPKGTYNWYYKMDIIATGANTGVQQASTATGTDADAVNYSIALGSITSNSLDITFEHSEAAVLKGTAIGFAFKTS